MQRKRNTKSGGDIDVFLLHSSFQQRHKFVEEELVKVENIWTSLKEVHSNFDHFLPHHCSQVKSDDFIDCTKYDKFWSVLFENEFTRVVLPVDRFKNSLQDQFVSLSDKLKNLREKLKTDHSFAVISQIQQVISQMRQLAFARLLRLKKQAKSLRRKIVTCFSRNNRRTAYRRIIQFLFKNMDDESASDVMTAAMFSFTHFFKPLQWNLAKKQLTPSMAY